MDKIKQFVGIIREKLCSLFTIKANCIIFDSTELPV